MKIFIKILKINAGILLGLVFSFLTIVGLDAVLPSGNPFAIQTLNIWLVALIINGWLLLFMGLMFLKLPIKKTKTQGIQDLPVSISDFIDGVINAMKYRKSVRVEVRQELTDHFVDALADCKTEEERKKTTTQLIEEFGDIELLGKLLHRAKKRCRPLWRTMVVRFFQFVSVTFLLLILYIGWFFTGKPVITTNYVEVVNQIVRPVADDSQNAWPYYKQAAEKYVEYESEEEVEMFDFHPTNPSPFTRSEKDKQVIWQLISDNQESLALIRKGNQKPYYWRIYGTESSDNQQLISMLLPYLNEYKKLTNLMCWEGLLNAEQGEFQKSFDTLLDCYSFGDHLRGQNGTFIEQLVAMSVEGISRETLMISLAEYGEKVDVKLLDSARKRFSGMTENKKFIIDYSAEKLFMYDEAQRCFTQSRFGKSHLYLPRLRDLDGFDGPNVDNELMFLISKAGHLLFTHPDKAETLEEVERVFNLTEKFVTMTPASVKSRISNMDEIPSEVIKKNFFLSVFMPATSNVNKISWRVRTQTEASLVILALLQYEKQHDEYPESLDALVDANLLKEVPIDPFSDQPLIYRRTDGDFILYSVGYNSIDDGGTKVEDRKGNLLNWREGGDGIFWPVE